MGLAGIVSTTVYETTHVPSQTMLCGDTFVFIMEWLCRSLHFIIFSFQSCSCMICFVYVILSFTNNWTPNTITLLYPSMTLHHHLTFQDPDSLSPKPCMRNIKLCGWLAIENKNFLECFHISFGKLLYMYQCSHDYCFTIITGINQLIDYLFIYQFLWYMNHWII